MKPAALRIARKNPENKSGVYDDPPFYQYNYDANTKEITIIKSPVSSSATRVQPGTDAYNAIMGIIRSSDPVANIPSPSKSTGAAGLKPPSVTGGDKDPPKGGGRGGGKGGLDEMWKTYLLFAVPATVLIGGYFLLTADDNKQEQPKASRKKRKPVEVVEPEYEDETDDAEFA
jgi:hypothetical protein